MRVILASLLLCAVPAFAQAPAAKPATPPKQAACAECGVVQTVRSVTKELQPTESTETKPSGLVATVPLGGGKPKVGSSTKLGGDAVTKSTRWEVAIRYDDGRLRLFPFDRQPDFRQGDKVRVDANGQLKLRTD